MSNCWTRHKDGGPGWRPQIGRWYIKVDDHMVGYVQQLAPPGEEGFHAHRVIPGAPVGKYDTTWKTLKQAAEWLATAAAGDAPITDAMVDAALQGQAKCLGKASPTKHTERAREAMRAALRSAAPLLLESHALTATRTAGIPYLTHEIRAKVEYALSTAGTPEEVIRLLVAHGVFAGDQWVLDAMAETEPTSGAPGAPPVERDGTDA
jgi:hypothetical protein